MGSLLADLNQVLLSSPLNKTFWLAREVYLSRDVSHIYWETP